MNLKILSLLVFVFSIITYNVSAHTININFYDESTFLPIPDVNIVDANGSSYLSDVNGFISLNLVGDKNLTITKVNYDSRPFQFNFVQDTNYTFLLNPFGEDIQIPFLVKDLNNNVWDEKYLTFERNNEHSMLNYLNIDNTAAQTEIFFKTKIPLKLINFKFQAVGSTTFDLEINDVLGVEPSCNQYNSFTTVAGTNYDLNFTNCYLAADTSYVIFRNGGSGSVFPSGGGIDYKTNPYIESSGLGNFQLAINSTHPTTNNLIFEIWDMNNTTIINSIKTDEDGMATSSIQDDGDYNAILYDEDANLETIYLKTDVEVKKPRDEITGSLISPWRFSVGGNLQYADTNITENIANILIFGGTTTPYNFTICDWNEIPAYELYVPRTYNVTNPWGSEYDPYYTFQPYLISKADAIAPSIQVIDKLKRPVANIKLEIYGLVNGVTTLIENKYSDATGRVSFSAVPLNLYQVYMYRDNGTILAGTYEIQPRTNNDVFFLMIDLAEPINVQGYAFINIDWDATPESININLENLVVDANVFSYSQNYDVNITSYTMAIYQNGVLLDTENFTNSGETAKPYNSYDYNLFSGGGLYPTADIYIIVNYTFLGQTYQKVFKKTIATIETSTGLLWSAKQIPNEIGRFWCVILALLITIGILFSLSSSGFVENTNVIAILGLLILGIFVFIDWLNIGVTVLGVDIMVYTYILCCVFGVYLMMKDGLR